MSKGVVYDLEVFPNLLTFAFASTDLKDEYIEKFKQLDIDNGDTLELFRNELKGDIFVISEFENIVPTLLELKQYVDNCSVMIGYNNINYDDILLFYILYNIDTFIAMERNGKRNEALLAFYNASQTIITSDRWIFHDQKRDYKRYKNKPISIDLQKLNHLDQEGAFVSLKQCQINIRWHNVKEFQLPDINELDAHYYYHYITKGNEYEKVSLSFYPNEWSKLSKRINTFDRYIPIEYIDDVLYYNVNDTMSTLSLYLFSKPEIQQRAKATAKYNVNVLTLARSTTGERLISNIYFNQTGETYREVKDRINLEPRVIVKDIIDPKIELHAPVFKDLIDKFNKTIIYVGAKSFAYDVIYGNIKLNLGKGGIHSEDRFGVLKSEKGYILRDADAESYYPTTIINNELCPSQLNKEMFLPMYIDLRNQRIHAKHSKYNTDGSFNQDNADINEILKQVLNSVYGKSNEPTSILYDPNVTFGVTINCQLYLIELIERLYEKGIEAVSVNTDGVVCKVPIHKEDIYYDVCKEWETKFNQTLEYTNYSKYFRVNVNSYMAITDKGKIKRKKDFYTETELGKGYIHPIVSKGLVDYFINNGDLNYIDTQWVDNYLRNSTDIYDFCIAVKIGRQFNVEYSYFSKGEVVKDILPHTNRYYVSNYGGSLVKSYKDKAGSISVVSGEYVRMINKFYRVKDMSEYDIKYNFYKAKIMEVINTVFGNSFKIDKNKKTDVSGKLFDELE